MRKDDDDSDLGLSAMMARNVTSATTSRGRDGGRDKAGKRISRSRSRSSSVLRKLKGKKKDSAPDAPRRDRSCDGTDDDNKSVASRKSMKSTRSRTAKARKNKSVERKSKSVERRSKSIQSSIKTPTKPESSETAPPNSGSSEDKEKKTKRRSKKIRRVRRPGSEGNESGDDEYTIASKQSTRSTKSSDSLRSKKSRLSRHPSKSAKNKVSKQYKETSSRVEAIREPILTNEGVVIKDEMDNLFPLPTDQKRNTGKAKRRPSTGKDGKGNGVGNNLNSDTDGVQKQPRSILASHSQKSLNSTSGSTGSFRIMTNKAAKEQATAALNRVAAHQSMEIDVSGVERRERQHRRFSNGSTRSKEQYQRLHRDSGLTSLTSVNENDDDKSFGSRRSQSNFTAMTALQKRLDEHKAESENLQKRLYEALAEVEQCNNNLRKEKERSVAAEGNLSDAKSELDKTLEEKEFLIDCVRDMETEFELKDERVLKLQEVVETQLDTVEFLEDKLNETEEELVLMEDEITELIDVVEETNKTSEQINQAKTKGQGRVAKMVSMREDLTSRKGSIKVQKEESRRVLSSSSQDRPKSERSRKNNTMPPVSESNDVEKLQNDLKTREAKLKADLEECNNREQRLDTWERELFELEDQLKKSNNGAENSNSEHELLITLLQEEKEDLHKTQIETQSKLKGLEFENDDLRVKLDRVTKMATENQRQIPVKSTDIADALALVEKKEKIIKSLEDKIETLKANGGSSQDEEDGKDLLIRELQNQLVNTKKEANSLSSGNYVTRLKLEIKKLRESVRDLKKRLKDDDATFKSNLQKQDDSTKLLEKQMQKLKIELERRDKREKNFGTDKQRISDSDLQNHIEDLEDEISHWKSTNADLENEIEELKANVNEEQDYYLSDDDIEDDCSIGSLASVNSRMSLSVSHEDNFFLTDSTHSVGNLEEPQTPSRAMRTVSNLWSKMRNGPEPPNTIQAFPYGPGSLND